MALRRNWLNVAYNAAICVNQNGNLGRLGQLHCLLANHSRTTQKFCTWTGLRHVRRVSSAVRAVPVPSPWREFPAGGQVFLEETEVGRKTVTFETGKLARFAAGAVVVSIKETKVLTTAVSEHTLKDESDFLPLQVEYKERQYAQGRIPKTFMRREGAPSERELLVARLVDRSIRPLFGKGFFFETQIIANVLSSDGDQDPDVLSVNAASAALTVSDIPWSGPIGAVRVGRVDGKLIVNPNMEEVSQSDLNLVYACTASKALMIETQAAEITNRDYAAALEFAHYEAVKLIEPQMRLAAKVKNEKRFFGSVEVPSFFSQEVRHLAEERVRSILENPSFGKFERGKALQSVKDSVEEKFKAEGVNSIPWLETNFDRLKKEIVRGNILSRCQRVDGRTLTDVRDVYCEAGLYTALHGSSLFSRGNTQVLCTVTMGPPDDAQRLEGLVGPEVKRFMVHYIFPPFAVNEVKRIGGLNRREVGHGTLAEKALFSLLPSEEEFPYSIRVTSEVLASDGSSSMATVCGASLALMDAGVPMRDHAAGVSVGLVTETDPDTHSVIKYKLLTDILGLEDHLGDMDFKIAGTRGGITAVQLDMKLPGVPLSILIEALESAYVGRNHIIDVMEQIIAKPRQDLRDNTPKKGHMMILRESIRRLIGPQGATIKNIQRITGSTLNVADDGNLIIYARDQACLDQTKELVEAAVGREVEVGCSYLATVVAIKDFGAFVELDGGLQGMVHISEISHNRVERIGDVLSVGEKLKVVCVGRDIRGNLKLSRKAAMSPDEAVSGTRRSLTDGPQKNSSGSVMSIAVSSNTLSDGFIKHKLEPNGTSRTKVGETVGLTQTPRSTTESRVDVKPVKDSAYKMTLEVSHVPAPATPEMIVEAVPTSKRRRVSTSLSNNDATNELEPVERKPRRRTASTSTKSKGDVSCQLGKASAGDELGGNL